MRNALILALALAAVAGIYAPGLAGGFVLDDVPNLEPITGYLRGELLWQGVVFSNGSGPLGRPLAMATLLLNALPFGLHPPAFKLVNLALHLGCGVLAALLTRRVLAHLPEAAAHAATWSLAVAIVWTLLPLHASTVLYTIQRMTLLSALLSLLALWLYCVARDRMLRDERGWGPLLWLAVPLATAASALSKENGIVTPALALVIDWSCFHWRGAAARRQLPCWYAVFLALPALGGLLALSLGPSRFLAAYEVRPYTLGERLLTELRVLWDYVAATFIPSGARLGIVHDDFVVSHGWLDPYTTLLAALAWLGLGLVAIALARRGRRLVPAGLLLYLVGHALESGIFPLELYFLHRNYLPSLGLLWMAVGILVEAGRLLPRHAPPSGPRPARLAIALLALVYAGALLSEVLLWRDGEALMRYAAATHPRSERAHSELAAMMVASGRRDEALVEFRAAAEAQPASAHAFALGEFLARCGAGAALDPLADPRVMPPEHAALGRAAVAVFAQLAGMVESGRCPELPATALVELGEAWIRPERARESGATWQIHYRIARLLAQAKRFPEALPHARAAWEGSEHELRVGLLALQLYGALGDGAGVRAQLAELSGSDRGWDLAASATMARYRAALAGPGAATP